MRRIRSVFDVAERQLCSGCGACASVEPALVELADIAGHGIRPVPRGRRPTETPVALRACPGVALHQSAPPAGAIPELLEAWGPVLEVWEGHAADPALRWAASSGGAATAIALHCMEREGMHGTVHITARSDRPYLNRTVLSTTRAELLDATGSRYAPASPCDSLHLIEQAPAPCVFIGKPCDVAGARMASAVRAGLGSKIGLTIAIFCAGTPSTDGTLEMMRLMGIDDLDTVTRVRYRGNGWPGMAVVETDANGEITEHTFTYDQSWNKILQKHRPWRCHICPDHTGEFADIAVGDPWYREISADEPGESLVLVRTELGRRIVAAARAARVLDLQAAPPSIVAASQPSLLQNRGAVWGRTMTTRALLVPTPHYRNLPTFNVWRRHVPLRKKAQSVLGTARRVVRRRLYRRTPLARET